MGKPPTPRWTLSELFALAVAYKGSALSAGEQGVMHAIYQHDADNDPPPVSMSTLVNTAKQKKQYYGGSSILTPGENATLYTVYGTVDGTSFSDYIALAIHYKHNVFGGSSTLTVGENAMLTALFYANI